MIQIKEKIMYVRYGMNRCMHQEKSARRRMAQVRLKVICIKKKIAVKTLKRYVQHVSAYKADIKIVIKVTTEAPRAEMERVAPAFCFRWWDVDVIAACAGA